MKKEILDQLYNAKTNIIVSGDMSTGKTANVLFPLVDKMINQNESLMILDTKEEYINKYYNKLKEKNYNIVVLNLRDLDKSDGWNPIQIAYELYEEGNKDKAIDYLDKVAKTIFYEKLSCDPYWTIVSADLFTGIVLALFEDAEKDEVNLNSVRMMLEGTNEKFGSLDYLTTYFKLKDHSSQAYISASTTVLAPVETKGSIISVAKQKLRAYVSREKLSMLLNKTTFDFNDIVTKPSAIFFVAKEENKYLNTIAAMFIEQLFSILFDNYDVKTSNKFNFVLDNFDVIENVNDFADMFGSGISRKIKFIVATRSLKQLSDKYGDYITKLSDIIHATLEILKIKINENEKIVKNKIEKVSDVYNDVDYPKLKPTQIKIFDLKKCVRESKKQSIINDLNEPQSLNSFSSSFNGENIDYLLKQIDEKIKKIEEKDKEVMDNNK